MFDIWSDKQNALMHSIQDSTYSLSKHWKYNFEKDTDKKLFNFGVRIFWSVQHYNERVLYLGQKMMIKHILYYLTYNHEN